MMRKLALLFLVCYPNNNPNKQQRQLKKSQNKSPRLTLNTSEAISCSSHNGKSTGGSAARVSLLIALRLSAGGKAPLRSVYGLEALASEE